MTINILSDGLHALSNEDAQAYLDLGITPRDVVRLRWPHASEEDANYILWELTPFPLIRGVHDIADAIAALDENSVPWNTGARVPWVPKG